MDPVGEKFEKLVKIMAQLRDPQGGCPWDLEQDHKSITPYLIEEAYEVIESIRAEDDAELAIELGDLLLQVIFHAQMAKERSAFTIDDVVNHISQKLVRRHPHVFGDLSVSNSDEVLRNWENIKLDENIGSAKPKTTLSGVPSSMPALLRAQRLGEKAAKVAFDWPELDGVWQKVCEEFNELQVEVDKSIESAKLHESAGDSNKSSNSNTPNLRPSPELVHELGDILFSLCQLARWMGATAEEALHEGCKRFSDRFEHMQRLAPDKLANLSAKEMDDLWNQAKKL